MGSTQLAAGFLTDMTTQEKDGQSQIFDTTSLKGIKDIRAERDRVTCLLPVTPTVQNRNGMLHGGCIATLVDVVGTAALLTVSPRGGVSLNINTNYLRPMPGGGTALIDAKVLRVGKSIATISVDIYDNSNMKLVAQGVHVKFISESEPDLTQLSRVRMALPPPPRTEPPTLRSKL